MILVDFSGIMVANVHALIAMNNDFDSKLYKQMTLYSIVQYKKKFTESHGDIVFAIDSKKAPYWRKEIFPHYKAARPAARKIQESKNSHVDWDEARQAMIEIVEDLDLVFPYKVIDIARCEADDIIGTLAKELHRQEPIVIVSRDHDFKQLQRYANVTQLDPQTKKLIKEPNPRHYLKEHIIRGDRGDGICNMLSANDCMTTGIKQKQIRKVWLESVIKKNVKDFAETRDQLDRYRENEKLVDLSFTPLELQTEILRAYDVPASGSNRNIQEYLMKNRMSTLFPELQHFLER